MPWSIGRNDAHHTSHLECKFKGQHKKMNVNVLNNNRKDTGTIPTDVVCIYSVNKPTFYGSL